MIEEKTNAVMASYLASIIVNEEQRNWLLTGLREAYKGDCTSNTNVRNIVFCLIGDGGTGKTTFLDVVSSVFADNGKVVKKLDVAPDCDYSDTSDLFTCEGFMDPSKLKFIVGDIGGLLLLTATKRPDMDPLDHGLNRRVTFIDVQRSMKFDRDEAYRSLLGELK